MQTLTLAMLALALPAPQTPPMGNERFAVELLRVLAASGENTIVSPYSIAEAFALVREGAHGTTASEIDAALHFAEGGALEELARLRKQLTPKPIGPKDWTPYEFAVANSGWVQQGYGLEGEFLERTSRVGGARFFDADFREHPDDVRARINSWVSGGTKGKIPELLPAGSLSSDARIVLVNAVYLRATWRTPFLPERTHPITFHAPSGDTEVRAMHQTETLRHRETSGARVVALPYEGGLELLVVLPKTKDGISALLANESLAEWTADMSSASVALALPKFETSRSSDLVAALVTLGVASAFDPKQADFSGISPRAKDPSAPLFIGMVRHSARISVDEKGTEAAAATAIGLKVGAAARAETPIPFVVDRPFLFFVRHAASHTVLFAGRVDDPRS